MLSTSLNVCLKEKHRKLTNTLLPQLRKCRNDNFGIICKIIPMVHGHLWAHYRQHMINNTLVWLGTISSFNRTMPHTWWGGGMGCSLDGIILSSSTLPLNNTPSTALTCPILSLSTTYFLFSYLEGNCGIRFSLTVLFFEITQNILRITT